MTGDEYRLERAEAEVLARIGRALFEQDLRVTVRMPAALAAEAMSAWDRDAVGELGTETDRERATRHEAGHLALVGLALTEHGAAIGGEWVVDLDAWQVGAALEAADERGLLAGLPPADDVS